MNTPALDHDSFQPEPGPLNGISVLDTAGQRPAGADADADASGEHVSG